MASGRAMTGILGYSFQYLEVPNGIWKDHDRQIGVPGDWGPLGGCFRRSHFLGNLRELLPPSP